MEHIRIGRSMQETGNFSNLYMYEAAEGLEATVSLAALGNPLEIQVKVTGQEVSVWAVYHGWPQKERRKYVSWELPKSISADGAIVSLDAEQNLLMISFPRVRPAMPDTRPWRM
ncbi:hypothetical protein KP509_04G053700 [Ceratopteris richardii]|uniref:Uncharacterized protein n=1 Tax=Ceratopteris richardii TaxID=49495 RepID=A0A8T2V0G4_CERRI|nr:hypothetical protein KP509_04G053700 [Ceratopteris richardii]